MENGTFVCIITILINILIKLPFSLICLALILVGIILWRWGSVFTANNLVVVWVTIFEENIVVSIARIFYRARNLNFNERWFELRNSVIKYDLSVKWYSAIESRLFNINNKIWLIDIQKLCDVLLFFYRIVLFTILLGPGWLKEVKSLYLL